MALLDEAESDDDAPAPPKPPPAPAADADPGGKAAADAGAAAAAVESVTAGVAAASLAPAAAEAEAEPVAVGGFQMSFGKKSKKQLQKEKKEAEAKRRYEEAKESMKDWDDPKVAEDQKLAMQLDPQGLKIKDIQPDGHCLYRALADQCVQNLPDLDPELAREVKTWEKGAGHTQMRGICAAFMRQHANDFAPFVDTDDFGAYVDKIESTAEWGGDVELTALARRSVQRLPRARHSNCLRSRVPLRLFPAGGGGDVARVRTGMLTWRAGGWLQTGLAHPRVQRGHVGADFQPPQRIQCAPATLIPQARLWPRRAL
jgi:hypothetical protein